MKVNMLAERFNLTVKDCNAGLIGRMVRLPGLELVVSGPDMRHDLTDDDSEIMTPDMLFARKVSRE